MDFSRMYGPCIKGTICVKIDDDVVSIIISGGPITRTEILSSSLATTPSALSSRRQSNTPNTSLSPRTLWLTSARLGCITIMAPSIPIYRSSMCDCRIHLLGIYQNSRHGRVLRNGDLTTLKDIAHTGGFQFLPMTLIITIHPYIDQNIQDLGGANGIRGRLLLNYIIPFCRILEITSYGAMILKRGIPCTKE